MYGSMHIILTTGIRDPTMLNPSGKYLTGILHQVDFKNIYHIM
jgi:hypothetical protein